MKTRKMLINICFQLIIHSFYSSIINKLFDISIDILLIFIEMGDWNFYKILQEYFWKLEK